MNNRSLNLNVIKRLKSKKHHVSAEHYRKAIERETEALQAYTKYTQQIEQLQQATDTVKHELSIVNEYHPILNAEESWDTPTNISSRELLNLRIGSPIINWDDDNRVCKVKILFKDRTGPNELYYVYAFNDALVNTTNIFDEMITKISTEITTALIAELKKHFKR